MSNTIDIKSGSGNNSMNSLSFIWKAKFNDNYIIFQFNEDGTENLFKEVKNKFDDLKEFSIYNKDQSIIYTVDLIKGFIYNNKQNIDLDLLKEEKTNIRLIFFRRHRIEMTEKYLEKSHNIIYFLGFQYNDKNNQNKKILLQIDSQGNFIIGD